MNQSCSAQVAPTIIFVDDAHTFGGAQIALGWAIRSLLSQRPAPTVICVCSPSARKAVQPIAGEHPNLRYIDCPPALPLNVFTFPLRLWPFYKLMRALFRQGPYTWWLNLAGIEFGLAPLLILRLHGLRPIAWLHNSVPFSSYSANKSLSTRIVSRVRDAVANRVLFGLYRCIVTPSLATESFLKGRLRSGNPIQTGYLYPTTGVESEPKPRGLDKGVPPALDVWMIGRVEYASKNNMAALHVLAHLLEQERSARLTVVGNGPDLASFREATRNFGLEGHVRFVDWEENPWKLVPARAIVLIPSFYEGMPLVATEAMLHGIRIVASPIPAFAEGIPNELIADAFSTEAFADKIEEVAAINQERLIALYATVLDKFTAQAFVTKFQSILQAAATESSNKIKEATTGRKKSGDR